MSSSVSTVSVSGSLAWPGHLRLAERVLDLQRLRGLLALVEARLLAAEREHGEGGEQESRTGGSHGPVLLATVHVVALFGPTGVGKTAVAIALADLLRERGEDPIAVSADALQVYRGLETLTGAATADEQARLEHRLLSFVDPRETFSAGEFAERAHAEIDAALAAGRRPIVVGGTGLYLQAALTDLELRPPPDPAVRERIQARLDATGPERLHARAGRPGARDRAGDRPPRPHARRARARAARDGRAARARPGEDSRLWTADLRHPTRAAAASRWSARRSTQRIDARVDEMVAAGAAAGGRAGRCGRGGAHRPLRARLRGAARAATSRR